MKPILSKFLVLSAIVLFYACKTNDNTEKLNVEENADQVLDHVNPFIGTAPLTDTGIIGYTPPEGWRVWAGLTFPGAALPNAMVQLSPVTQYGSGSGYQYEDPEILAFAHTNKGHWNLVNIPVLPIPGDASPPFGSSFSHQTENASPGFYEVFLEDYRVQVRLSSTLRAGIHEYEYETDRNRKIVFDLGKANNRVSNWEIKQVGTNSLSCYQRVGGDQIHFYAELSHPIEEINKVREKEQDGFAVVNLSDGGESVVLLRIGLSFVSTENARNNLNIEIGDATFEEVRQAAAEKWQNLLSSITVEGASSKEKEIFYSSLYRTFLWPALRSDINCEFRDLNGEIQKEDFAYYTNPSFWDTYRNKLVLLTIMRPEVTEDIIKSLIHKGGITGFIPTFFHGDHAAPFIVGAYNRGIRDFDVQKAYRLLLNNAYLEGGSRPYITEYIDKGYISDPEVAEPEVETKGKAGVSKTLEYAYDDYSLAQLAKSLGDEKKYRDQMERSRNYRNVFDTTTNFMRGRLENGDWITPFNPEYPYYEYMFREANAWQVSFFAPHDMPGLIDLYGGASAFEQKLDSLFTFPWNPDYIARNVSGFLGQYAHGNQPDHEAPFSYYFIGKPGKSQKVIDRILRDYYGIGENGLALSGMDDAGEMSSWYVMAALGLYPISPADARYLVTVPIFDEIKWQLDHNKELVIRKPNPGRKLEEIVVNGKPIDGYFIPHELFVRGGEIEIITSEL